MKEYVQSVRLFDFQIEQRSSVLEHKEYLLRHAKPIDVPRLTQEVAKLKEDINLAKLTVHLIR